MDAFIFRLLAAELAQFVYGCRVEKIHSPYLGVSSFTLSKHGLKRLLIFCHAKSCNHALKQVSPLKQNKIQPCFYLAGAAPSNPPKPSNLIMTLRKYVEGRRIGQACNDWLNRRLFFALPQNDFIQPPLWLCLDLDTGPSLTAQEPETAPLVWPDFDLSAAEHRERLQNGSLWKDFAVLTPLLRKTLLRLEPSEAAALLADLQHETETHAGDLHLYAHADKRLTLSAWPLPAGFAPDACELEIPRSDPASGKFAMLEAARMVYEPQLSEFSGRNLQEESRRETAYGQKRCSSILSKLEQEEIRLKQLLALRQDAVLLQSCLWRFKADERLEKLAISAEEAPDGTAHIVLLDHLRSVRENMAQMFKQSARGARGLEIVAQRRLHIQNELEAWKNGQPIPASRFTEGKPLNAGRSRAEAAAPSGPAQRFVSVDGFLMLRGRSAKANCEMLKMARPHDLWLHVQDGPSTHLIICRASLSVEVPQSTLLEAGLLVAEKSWKKHDCKAEIMCALVKNVRLVKGGSPGSVLVEKVLQSFVVRWKHRDL